MDKNSNNSFDFGSYLKSLRKKEDLTLIKLQKAANVSNSYLSQLENNQFKPSNEVLRKLSNPLGVSYEELMYKAGHIDEETYKGLSNARDALGQSRGEYEASLTKYHDFINDPQKWSKDELDKLRKASDRQNEALRGKVHNIEDLLLRDDYHIKYKGKPIMPLKKEKIFKLIELYFTFDSIDKDSKSKLLESIKKTLE